MELKRAKASVVDNLLGVISPQAKLRRLNYKDKILFRKYEAASTAPQMGGWITGSGSANNFLGSLTLMRDRSRDLVRNNEHAGRAKSVLTSYTVGAGIKTRFLADDKKKEDALNKLWKNWTDKKHCDFAGRHNFYGLQQMVMDGITESGEILIRKRRSAPTFENPLGYQIQLLESDHLKATGFRQKLKNGNYLLQGIEFDPEGRRVSYHIYKSHPGGPSPFGDSALGKTIEVPANDVMHPYREDRTGQVRGIPWTAPIIIKLHKYDGFEDAVLTRQRIANCFAVYVHDIASDDGDDMIGVESSTKASELADAAVTPGTQVNLPAGKTISTPDTPGAPTTHKDYSSVTLHAVAAGVNVPYFLLTQNYSEVNFSSARMGMLSFYKDIKKWRTNFYYTQFLNEVVDEFLKMAMLAGYDVSGVTYDHTPPRQEMIDPTKEVPAKVKEVRAGLTTLTSAIEEMGRDPDEHFKQFKKDNEKLDSLGLILDSDARRVNATGKAQDDIIIDEDNPAEENERSLQ